jgi:hemerythrin-like domain-containing protein
MKEHRMIEAIVAMMSREISNIEGTNEVDTVLVDIMVQFLRNYADRLHHGKEEQILFRALREKELSQEHSKMLNDLILEHESARTMAKSLDEANRSYAQGDTAATTSILKSLQNLMEHYPTHIQKEDKQFFVPSLKYFSKEELEDMLEEFHVFDEEIAKEQLT